MLLHQFFKKERKPVSKTVCTGHFEMPDSYAADVIPGIRQGTAVSLLKVIPTKGVTFDRNTQICQAEVLTGLRHLGPYLRFSRYFSLQSLHKSFFSFILNVYFFLIIEIAMRWKNLLKWPSSQNGR